MRTRMVLLLFLLAFLKRSLASENANLFNLHDELANQAGRVPVILLDEQYEICVKNVRELHTNQVTILYDDGHASEADAPWYALDGFICDDAMSEILLEVTPDKVSGSIILGGKNFILKDNHMTEVDHVVVDDDHELTEAERLWLDSMMQDKLGRSNNNEPMPQGSVDIFLSVEVDPGFISDLGGDTEAVRYVVQLIDWINTNIYYPIGFNLQVSEVHLRSWNLASPDAQAYVDTLASMGQPTNAHLRTSFSNHFQDGGLARMGGLYSQNWMGGWSGVSACTGMDGGFSKWDRILVAHELGHNFGAPHTHDLGIDNCAGGVCPGGSSGTPGTLMSYCHMCPGWNNNILMEFDDMILNDWIYGSYERDGEHNMNEVSNDAVPIDENGNPVIINNNIHGCTDSSATNYNPQATVNDGSCTYTVQIHGCTDTSAINYNWQATVNDGSCIYPVQDGCPVVAVTSLQHPSGSTGRYFYFNADAWTQMVGTSDWNGQIFNVAQSGSQNWSGEVIVWNNQNGVHGRRTPSSNVGQWSVGDVISLTNCVVSGCTDSDATNYNSEATVNDGSCTYDVHGCTDSDATNYNAEATVNDGSCTYNIHGCMDSAATNYNSQATVNDGSCTYDVLGCTDSDATNYNSQATVNDGSCTYGGQADPATCEACVTAGRSWQVGQCNPTDECLIMDTSCWTPEIGCGADDCSSVSVTSLQHPSGSNGRYFYFDAAAWTEMVGTSQIFNVDQSDWNGQIFNVDQSGSHNWSGEVIVWDNQNGVHGRRTPSSDVGQWSVGDVISLTNCAVSVSVSGCTDSGATNYNPQATVNDGSCTYDVQVHGCTDTSATNYNSQATVNDGSCVYGGQDCVYTQSDPNYYLSAYANGDSTKYTVAEAKAKCQEYGDSCGGFTCESANICTVRAGTNLLYFAGGEVSYVKTCQSGSVYGCTDNSATNYNSQATVNDGSCTYNVQIYGCTDSSATNYNSQATVNDGSCTYNTDCSLVEMHSENYGNEISWTISGCDCFASRNTYPDYSVTASDCCLDDGSYTLTCEDSYGDGWHSGFLEIGGVAFCETFTSGSSMQESFVVENGIVTKPNGNVYGCTDSSATNYNSQATVNDGSCTYNVQIHGCTDSDATNYNSQATVNDGSCIYGGQSFGSQGSCPSSGSPWEVPANGRDRKNWGCCSSCSGGTSYCYDDCGCMCSTATTCEQITREKDGCFASVGCHWNGVSCETSSGNW